ncbi:sporulation protein YunB [Sporolactobacillus shoreicorticis]|uniref:Sporulation protein YunB n=1 Tax=Sporolactobacillus shoreicorticis TaxID=1923877 RepID=A0ABW5S926_9BACL|nr:sporulation protein YunB [Sporolactobacillus shoreicorticis]MCO7127315.1 sporulation protein YunB [Sporolactobacillus shoreicorticis]
MFKPSRRYRRKNMSIKHTLFLSLFIFILCISIAVWIVNEKMKPAVMSIALTQTEQIGNYAINYGTGQEVLSNVTKENDPNEIPTIDYSKLIVTHRTDDNKVTDFDLNMEEANRLKGIISNRILWFLRAAEKGRISLTNGHADDLVYSKHHNGDALIADIPLGQVLNNALLSNYGPRVPVEMDIVSNVETDIKTKYGNVGINNPLYLLYLKVKVKVDVIVPFEIKTKTIVQRIPFGGKNINPGVPYYYSSNGSGISTSVPIETPKTDEKKKSDQ